MKELKQAPSYERGRESIGKMAVKIVGYSVLAAVMSLFVSFSVIMLANGALTDTIGYREYEMVDTDGDGQPDETVLLGTVMYDEETSYSSQKVTADDERRISREMITQPKNDFCAALMGVVDVCDQLIRLALLFGLCGYYLYREGDHDRNLVKHHGEKEQLSRGLYMGLLGSVPFALLYLLLLLGKGGVMAETAQGIYRFGNICYLPLVNLIMPQDIYPATQVGWPQLALLFLLLLPLPAVCGGCYVAGYKRLWKPKKKKRA